MPGREQVKRGWGLLFGICSRGTNVTCAGAVGYTRSAKTKIAGTVGFSFDTPHGDHDT